MTNSLEQTAREGQQSYPLSLIDISHRGLPRKARERMRRMEQRKEKNRIRRKSIHKKLVKGSAASVLGLSITLAGLFPSSSELLRQQTIRQLENANPIEMVLEEELLENEEEDRKKAQTGASGRSLPERLRQFLRGLVLKLPLGVRACVALPLWGIGYLVLHLLSGLYQAVLSPVLAHIIGFVLLAAVLLGVFVLTMKSIFPHMPLKKILRWKNIRWILLGAAVLKVLDLLLPVFWDAYARYKPVVLLAAGCVVLGVILVPWIRRYQKKHQKRPEGT